MNTHLMEYVNVGQTLADLRMEDVVPLVGACLLFLAMFVVAYATHKKRTQRINTAWERDQMSKSDREKYYQTLVSDIITEGIEDAVYKGTLHRIESRILYRRLSKQLDLPDLYRKSPQAVKVEIKDRLEKKVHKPVPLPDAKKSLRDLIKPRNQNAA